MKRYILFCDCNYLLETGTVEISVDRCLDSRYPLNKQVLIDTARKNVPEALCAQCFFDQKIYAIVVSRTCLYNIGCHKNTYIFFKCMSDRL